ncbi:MAG: AAA family ATPase [Lachnospiraceae bacterium]|nr:AAA family ATPase [Lachnospiraceae bacterium]
MAKILMCGSFKGGVGKTASSWNLAYSLAEMGKKVLAVDFDSQANLSTCFGIEDTAAVPVTIGHLMMDRLEDEELPDAEDYIRSRNGVDFILSSMVLSAVEGRLRTEMGAERMLSGILEPLRERYDYIILDTCPSLGTLTINALTAADEVLIAVNPQLLAMMGLQDFIRTVKKVRSRLNDRLEIAGILFTMCDARTNLCKVITEQVTETFEGQIRIFRSVIPNTVKVGESIYYSEPLLEYAPGSKACTAYRNLAREVVGNESECTEKEGVSGCAGSAD